MYIHINIHTYLYLYIYIYVYIYRASLASSALCCLKSTGNRHKNSRELSEYKVPSPAQSGWLSMLKLT